MVEDLYLPCITKVTRRSDVEKRIVGGGGGRKRSSESECWMKEHGTKKQGEKDSKQ